MSNKYEGWAKIREKVLRRASYTCEICGKGSEVLHAHEIWAFDDKRHIQYLTNIICVCKKCHDVIHFGRSLSVYDPEYIKELVRHWCEVNGLGEKEFWEHEREAFEKLKERNKHFWVVKVKGRVLV